MTLSKSNNIVHNWDSNNIVYLLEWLDMVILETLSSGISQHAIW